MNAEVCAAIITYNPDTEFERAVRMLRPQVGRLVVVDNHSRPPIVARLRALADEFDFSLIENPDNYGIGTGLNQSIEWIRENANCDFVLFFDQDSFISETFVAEITAEYRKHAESEKVFVVMPKIVFQRTGATYTHPASQGRYLVAQTSGSLMPLRVFKEEGLYRQDLFIDYVDYEFCLRTVSHGWKIVYCESAVLQHDPGHAKQCSLFGIKKVTTTNHSPVRRYYLMRNGIWTVRQYAALYPRWAIGHVWQMMKEMVRVLIFEHNRRGIVAMWLRAVRDVVRSRFGKYPSCDASVKA